MTPKQAAVCAAAALIVLAVFVLHRSRENPGRAQGAKSDAVANPSTSSMFRERPAIKDAAASPVAEDIPAGSIVARRVLFDELREAAGQTPASVELARLDDFRPPTAAEAKHPKVFKLYTIDHEIYRSRVLSRHEKLESRRFRRDAERAENEDDRALLARSSRYHTLLARGHRKRVARLTKKRAALATQIYSQDSSAADVTAQSDTAAAKETVR